MGISILTGKFSNKYNTTMDIKNMIKEKFNDLFSYSYDYVGDLAETFSLLWPKKKKSKISLNFL